MLIYSHSTTMQQIPMGNFRDKNIGWTQYIFISYPTGKEHLTIARKIRNYINTKIHLNLIKVPSLLLTKMQYMDNKNYTKIPVTILY